MALYIFALNSTNPIGIKVIYELIEEDDTIKYRETK